MMGEKLKMGAILTTMELMDVVGNTLTKAAKNNDNFGNLVFIFYSHALGSLFLAPAAFIFHRKVSAPKLTCLIFSKLLLLACLSYWCGLSMYIGVGYASPRLASAMDNLFPAYSFILPIFFRMEAANLREMSSLLKVSGTLVSICGAIVVTFYKGMPINLHSPSKSPHGLQASLSASDWVIGGVFLSLSYLLALAFSRITGNAHHLLRRDHSVCNSCSNTRGLVHLEIMFQHRVTSGFLYVEVVNTVQSWAFHKKGPVYVAMLKPLQMIIAAALGVVFLGDSLHLGSVIGCVTIAAGFYTVMQGKAKEILKDDDCGISYSEPSPDQVPLLAIKSTDP